MKDFNIYGWDMALMSETYLSMLSEKLSPEGLERFYVPFLFIHENSGKVSQADLANVMKRDKVMISRIVDFLDERGLVSRIQDPNDRRAHLLTTSAKAKKLIPKVLEAVAQTNKELFGDFTEEEKIVFERGMHKLMNKIDALPESAYVVKAYKRKRTKK